MKKFFKTLSLLIFVLLLVFSLVFNYNVMIATADDSDTEDNSQYIDTRNYDLYQLDDVDSLTTSELLEEVMNYPYLLDLLLYDDFEYGLHKISEKYNGLEELLERDDLLYEISTYSSCYILNFNQRILISYIQSRDYNYIETTIYTILNNPVYAIQYLTDLSSDEISDINTHVNLYFPYAIKLGEPTNKYNCHSYAWYNQDITTNNIWLPYPESFKTDCYYPQTTWQAGDILVYVENGIDIHSAIIETTDGTLSGTTVISKWGPWGLYRHAANYNPYYYYNYTNIIAYRLCINHSFINTPYNIIMHQKICSNCSYSYLEAHTLNPLTGRCALCGDRCLIIEPNADNHID